MAKTIYTFLYNDDLNGSRIITMDNCFCKLFSIRRSDNEFMQQFRSDLEKTALYILLNREKRRAYIGETDAFLTRLTQHIARKSFWTEALSFTSTDDSLTKTEVQYLESLAYGTAAKKDSYDLSENTIVPKAPHMNYMLKSKTDEFFKYVQYLTKFIGCDIFEKRKATKIQVSAVERKESVVSASGNSTIVYGKKITAEDIKGRVGIILNGKATYKARLGYSVVKEFLREHPNTSMSELKQIFHNDLLGEWIEYNLLEEDIRYARSLKKTTGAYKHQADSAYVLTSGDGIKFVVSNQWGYGNTMNLVDFAIEQGWSNHVKKETN